MNKRLSDLNDRLKEIEIYFLPRSFDDILNMSMDERRHYITSKERFKQDFSAYIIEAQLICEQLSPQELVDSFDKVCESLREQIAIFMTLHYNTIYLELMLREINKGKRCGTHLLAALAENMGLKATPYIISALENINPKIQDIALGLVMELGISEAKDIVKRLTNSDNSEVAYTAKLTLEHLNSM